MRTRSLLLISVLACAGCAAQPRAGDPTRPSQPASASTQAPAQPSAPPPVNLSGYSGAFKAGYTDGCASARGTPKRDETRYRSDSDYMMGWSDGNSVCRARR